PIQLLSTAYLKNQATPRRRTAAPMRVNQTRAIFSSRDDEAAAVGGGAWLVGDGGRLGGDGWWLGGDGGPGGGGWWLGGGGWWLDDRRCGGRCFDGRR